MTAPHPEPDFIDLARRAGHSFDDLALLRRAMAHRSWCAEVPGDLSNERLEFLGDAVLGWIVADLAYRHQAELAEGRLTDVRKALVNAATLAEVARAIGLGSFVLLGKGEQKAGGRDKPSILADALEALIGAVYIDGGATAASQLIERLFGERIARAGTRMDQLDHKTMLQELAARSLDAAPVYHVSGTGPDHAKQFVATVIIGGDVLGRGEGASKKVAEQAAAEQAWSVLRSRHARPDANVETERALPGG